MHPEILDIAYMTWQRQTRPVVTDMHKRADEDYEA